MSKRPLTELEAVQIVGPHMEMLEQCLKLGWAEWERTRDYHSGNGHSVSPRARANTIYDFVAIHARRLFANVAGVRVANDHGFLTLIFGNALVVRFKKLNTNLEWSSIPTEQQQLFERQEVIPGLPARATFLVAGYVLDATGTRVTRLVLTCRDAGGLLWAHELGQSFGGGAIIPLPAPTSAPAPLRLRSKIRKEDPKEAN